MELDAGTVPARDGAGGVRGVARGSGSGTSARMPVRGYEGGGRRSREAKLTATEAILSGNGGGAVGGAGAAVGRGSGERYVRPPSQIPTVPAWRRMVNCFWGEGQGAIERESVPGIRRLSQNME